MSVTRPAEHNHRRRSPRGFLPGIALAFAAALPACVAAADSPSPLAPGGDNPALTRFAKAVVFYVSFDGHALAEIGQGNPAPQGNTNWTAAVLSKALVFEPGVSGQALLARDYQLSYLCTGAVLQSSGSIALWLKPVALNHRGTYCWPVMLHAVSGGYGVMLGRMGDTRNREALYAHLGHGDAANSAISGSMAAWQTEVWHLLVVTWDRNSVAFSVDGAAPVQTALKSSIQSADAAGFRLFLLSPGEDTFAYDELLLLNMPLSKDEIQWLYVQGARTRQAGSAEP